MRVISRKKLLNAWSAVPDLEKPLSLWFKNAERATWVRFHDVRATFADVDQVGGYFVFNILGNRFRLICKISFEKGKVYVREILTHAEYDRDKWKGR